MSTKKTYGVSTLIRTLRYGSIQSILSGKAYPGDWQINSLRETLADLDYVRDRVIARIKELEEQTRGHE